MMMILMMMLEAAELKNGVGGVRKREMKFKSSSLIGINTFGSEKYQALNYAIGVSEIVKFLSSSN